MRIILWRAAPLVAGVAMLACVPTWGSAFQVDLALRVMVLAIFALSLQVLVGMTGLVSLGHAAYFGIAAYTVALLQPFEWGSALVTALPLAILAAGVYALAVGALSLRTRGAYFIMVTLAFAQLAYFVFHDTRLGGGTDGTYVNVKPALVIGGARILDLADGQSFYYFVLMALIVSYAFLALLDRARFGRALAGIRVNEGRMRAAGFSTYPYKLAAFVLAGLLAGLAGFLHAVKDGFVNPELLSWHQSGAVLLMVILGGTGSLRGAVLGACGFVMLQECFQSEALFGRLARHWQLPLGLAIIACVALMPQGIAGVPAQWARRTVRTK